MTEAKKKGKTQQKIIHSNSTNYETNECHPETCKFCENYSFLRLEILRLAETNLPAWSFNPLTPMSDQDRISPYNINTISGRQVMRKKKNINQRIISWSNTKFSKLTPQELYDRQWGELLKRSWGLNG